MLDGIGDSLAGRWSGADGHGGIATAYRQLSGRLLPEQEEVSVSGVWDICVEGECPRPRSPA